MNKPAAKTPTAPSRLPLTDLTLAPAVGTTVGRLVTVPFPLSVGTVGTVGTVLVGVYVAPVGLLVWYEVLVLVLLVFLVDVGRVEISEIVVLLVEVVTSPPPPPPVTVTVLLPVLAPPGPLQRLPIGQQP